VKWRDLEKSHPIVKSFTLKESPRKNVKGKQQNTPQWKSGEHLLSEHWKSERNSRTKGVFRKLKD
jgi:hypothetical protein